MQVERVDGGWSSSGEVEVEEGGGEPGSTSQTPVLFIKGKWAE